MFSPRRSTKPSSRFSSFSSCPRALYCKSKSAVVRVVILPRTVKTYGSVRLEPPIRSSITFPPMPRVNTRLIAISHRLAISHSRALSTHHRSNLPKRRTFWPPTRDIKALPADMRTPDFRAPASDLRMPASDLRAPASDLRTPDLRKGQVRFVLVWTPRFPASSHLLAPLLPSLTPCVTGTTEECLAVVPLALDWFNLAMVSLPLLT